MNSICREEQEGIKQILLESLKFIKSFGTYNKCDSTIENISIDMERMMFRAVQKDFGQGVIIRESRTGETVESLDMSVTL